MWKSICVKFAVVLYVTAAAASCGIGLMPSQDAWYARHYWIMQDFEREIYREIPKAARPEFQALFWEFRTHEAKKTFDERLTAVTAAFKNENYRQPWNTDRARVYLLNGRPAGVETRQTDDWSMRSASIAGGGGDFSVNDRTNEDIQAVTAEIWTYPYGHHIVQYAFTFVRPNEWRMSPAIFGDNRYVGELETRNKETVFGVTDMLRYRQRLQTLGKTQ